MQQAQQNTTPATGAFPSFETTANVPVLLTEQELHEITKRSVKAIQKDRLDGIGPKFVKLGRLVRYRAADVVEWLEKQTRTSTADTGATD